MTTQTVKDLSAPLNEEDRLYQEYRRYIVGQDAAIRRLVRKFTHINILDGQIRDTGKPAGVFFLFGTSGAGKTLLAEVTAKIFFGRFDALTKIRGGDLQLEHQITTLVGAPPSYVGHDREAVLSQEKLDKWGHQASTADPVLRRYFDLQSRIDAMFLRKRMLDETERAYTNSNFSFQAQMVGQYERSLKENKGLQPRLSEAITERDRILEYHAEFRGMEQEAYSPEHGYPSIVLVDEFEKANPAVWKLFLEMLDKAELTVQGQSGETIHFRNTFFFFTSNIAQDRMLRIVGKNRMGFSQEATTRAELEAETERVRREVRKIGYEEISRSFPPEFVSRVGEGNVFAFAPLTRDETVECLERIILPRYNQELSEHFPVTVEITCAARDFLVDTSRDKRNCTLGGRALNVLFERHVKEGVSVLMSKKTEDGGIIPGDRIVFDREGEADVLARIHRDKDATVIGKEEFERMQHQKQALDGDKKLVPFRVLL